MMQSHNKSLGQKFTELNISAKNQKFGEAKQKQKYDGDKKSIDVFSSKLN